MDRAAYIVEGFQEKRFLQRACPNRPVRIIGCNGKNVCPYEIARRIASHYRQLTDRCYPIITWLDLEGRTIRADLFRSQLLEALSGEGVGDDLVLGIADRMIENWILADSETVSDKIGSQFDMPDGPDVNGKAFLSSIFSDYHETTSGVELLLKCRPSKMRQSPSFNQFYQLLPENGCYWLSK